MSIRANVKIVDEFTTLWLYRHSDGYPDSMHGALHTIGQFMQAIADVEIRNNASQSIGHLIDLGVQELAPVRAKYPDIYKWKAGTYEVTDCQHIDIEFLYVCAVEKNCLEVFEASPFQARSERKIATIKFFKGKRPKVRHVGPARFSTRDSIPK